MTDSHLKVSIGLQESYGETDHLSNTKDTCELKEHNK
jgi:hypothetical protein